MLFLIDANKKEIENGDMIILNKLKEANKKVILVINKIDLISKKKLLQIIDSYNELYSFNAVVPISASKNKGIKELIEEIEKIIPEGPAYYNTDEYTDQSMRQIVEETIREKMLKLLQDEVPHGVLVEVSKMKKRKTREKEEIFDVDAAIYCLRNSHKGIIIGKDGNMLKKIGSYARHDLENLFQTKINLQLWVKVKENWTDDENVIKKFKLE